MNYANNWSYILMALVVMILLLPGAVCYHILEVETISLSLSLSLSLSHPPVLLHNFSIVWLFCRSETKHAQQPPKYRLEFTCEVNDEIEKGQIIETKNNGKTISVVLYDDHNQIVAAGPFASASVMLVVVNGEFNQHGNQYNWSRKDFERNIKRPSERCRCLRSVWGMQGHPTRRRHQG